MSDANVDMLQALLLEAREKLAQYEAMVEAVPKLRRQIRILEKSLLSLTDDAPRHHPGLTISEAILEALMGQGGKMSFPRRGMTAAVHAHVGGSKPSIQVELSRMEKAGLIVVERDEVGPVGLRLPPEV